MWSFATQDFGLSEEKAVFGHPVEIHIGGIRHRDQTAIRFTVNKV